MSKPVVMVAEITSHCNDRPLYRMQDGLGRVFRYFEGTLTQDIERNGKIFQREVPKRCRALHIAARDAITDCRVRALFARITA